MFEVKKVLGQLLMPLPLSLILLMGLLLFVAKTRKAPYIFCWLSLLSIWSLSTPYVAQKIIETDAQMLTALDPRKHQSIDKIVVLGCDLYPNQSLPSNAQLGGCSLARLVEGVRLANLYPSAHLFVSGYGYGHATSAGLMAKTAQSLGIETSRIKQNPNPKDTADEAKMLAPMLIDYNVALVTSATHMQRAMDLFNAQGVETIPAPTEFYNFAQHPWSRQFIANHTALEVVTRVWHEQVGKVWIAIRRTIDPEAL
ncbi:YdcF family protein [Pseudoalteromonas sp. McH1-7]|uniref:DUF218 domain-containing protein n=1 Tax=Pseudoalteromonas peptidolytica F12-50-A1 TaxID=1315280 RepID=A0A8I0MUU7_9GAMM|nr:MULTISPECIES: ElyC/SanA/YdcF family protein [Pseudoalteromonas]MBE0345685.1 hypothetical protein [Pseudoalteromonas peptidolytica F12-50-A1]NLR14306.1 YdcF family protein [Pseudoalteromonas peptidolytica]NUZ11333.1 YdcF family protein [Pseudoalteromonas sp. McH1-7]USD27609.1 YdcF family protein [Pseudoalteromonas sp. SCSIO 43201]GEK09217.1 membrane protein [Pseudoalteromonas peptidolytica]